MINVFNLIQLQLDDNTVTVLPFKQQIIDQACSNLTIFFSFSGAAKRCLSFSGNSAKAEVGVLSSVSDHGNFE